MVALSATLEGRANARSAAGNEFPAAYESEANVRSAATDESVAAYESECRPGGPYGALKIVEACLQTNRSYLHASPGRGRPCETWTVDE